MELSFNYIKNKNSFANMKEISNIYSDGRRRKRRITKERACEKNENEDSSAVNHQVIIKPILGYSRIGAKRCMLFNLRTLNLITRLDLGETLFHYPKKW